MCAENEDIVLLKVDWDQNKPIARPLGVKVTLHMLFLHMCQGMDMPTIHVKTGEIYMVSTVQHSLCTTGHLPGRQPVFFWTQLSLIQDLASFETHPELAGL